MVKNNDFYHNSIFIFLLFWLDAPLKLVGWFSRVFTYDFRYYNDDVPSSMKTLFKNEYA